MEHFQCEIEFYKTFQKLKATSDILDPGFYNFTVGIQAFMHIKLHTGKSKG